MLNRAYFETVISDQLRLMERPSRLRIVLTNGEEYLVHALVAAHDDFVVLAVYSDGKAVEHSKKWQQQNPERDAEILDQIAVPYACIFMTQLTAKARKGDDAKAVIGFGQDPTAA